MKAIANQNSILKFRTSIIFSGKIKNGIKKKGNAKSLTAKPNIYLFERINYS